MSTIVVYIQEAAVMVGKKIAELCLQKNIEKVCFDRGGNIYHGRVQVRHTLLQELPCQLCCGSSEGVSVTLQCVC